MQRFPVVSGNHLNCIPGTTIQKSSVGTFAGALLATNAKVRVYFDSAKRRMVLVGQPEHACFNGTILYAGRRTGTTSAAVSCDRKDARTLLSCRLSITVRHWPVLVDETKHALCVSWF